ncbi:hypothetical protein [Streptomyces sp. NPDC001250]|uniref:hypothetical protein n=1 Tax=Streptomyces sp. NPDC001250 TaxID=3154382 RepID=UPI00332CDA71
MRPDQTLVTLQREGTRITARTSESFVQEAAAGTSEHEHPYGHLTTPLRQRGLACTVEYGLSDYIVHAELPDGSALIISPPQEPLTDHPPGYPESWLATRGHPDDSTLHEVIYDSEPDGPQPGMAAASPACSLLSTRAWISSACRPDRNCGDLPRRALPTRCSTVRASSPSCCSASASTDCPPP